MVVFLIEVVIRDDWIIWMILLSELDGTLILKRLGDVTHRVEIYGGFSLPPCTPSTSGGCRFQQGIADTSAIPSVMSRHIPNAWRTFGQVRNRIHHCTSPSLLMKFYIVVVCDVSRSEYTHALGHYLGGGQVGSTL